MDTFFTADFYSGNRRHLRQAVAADHADTAIVVTANGLLQKAGDTTFPFQQDSSFWYLTGVSEADLTLVIDGSDEFLIVPGRGASREAFDGIIDKEALRKRSGIKEILSEDAGWRKLEALLRKSRKVLTPQAPPDYINNFGMYTNPARAKLAERLRGVIDNSKQVTIEAVDIRPQLAALRVIKQPVELQALQRAIDITIDSLGLLTAPERFVSYQNEYEIEADLTREFRFRGAAGHAFAPIIAGGKRACTLHNVSNEAKLPQDSLVVLDVGAEVSHYAADITRTRIYGHKPSARQQAVFDAVLDVQAYALTLLLPGTLMKDYEQAVETYMGRTLQKLKLVKHPNHDEIRQYFPHATSHFLGLDVHDVGDYQLPLEVGTVLTCEPGIYISEEGIGVRIEDDVLITADGHTVLSSRLPKTLM